MSWYQWRGRRRGARKGKYIFAEVRQMLGCRQDGKEILSTPFQ